MRDDEANSVDLSVGRGDLGAELRRRSGEIVARIAQLHDRRRQLAAHFPCGSTADEVATAQAHAIQARRRAQRAHLRAAQRYEQAAEAHSRLAIWYERQGNLNRAEMHRVAASEDRTRASMNMHFAPEEQQAWNESD